MFREKINHTPNSTPLEYCLDDYYDVYPFNYQHLKDIIRDLKVDICTEKEKSTKEEFTNFISDLLLTIKKRTDARISNSVDDKEKETLGYGRNLIISNVIEGIYYVNRYEETVEHVKNEEDKTISVVKTILSNTALSALMGINSHIFLGQCLNYIRANKRHLAPNKITIPEILKFLGQLSINDLKVCYRHDNALIDVLNLEPELSAKILLENLKTSTDKESAHFWSSFLYRLEFGKISINKGGVKYLDKTYKISDKQVDSAHRITASGDIGLFDEENKLQNYFNLGDLSSKEKTIEPEIKEIDQNALFHEPKLNDADREKQIEEFKTLYLEFYSNDFFKKTGIRFNNLDLKEQCWFFFASKNNSEEKQAELYIFAKKCGERGLKSFISFEIGGTAMGEKILLIGNSLPEESANVFFNRVANLYDFAEKENKELAELLYKDGNQSSAWKTRQHLLQKAHDRIVEFSDKLSVANAESELTKVISDIENIKTEITLLVSVIKTAKKKEGTDNEKFNPDNLRGLNITLKNLGDDITPEQAKKMVAMAKQNWKGNPDEQAVISSLENALEKPQKNKFYSLNYQGELAAFVRYEELKPADPEIGQRGRLYAGSRNAHIETRGLAVAKHLIEKVHFLEAENNIIDALIESGNPDVSTQVEQFGFVIVGLEKSATATDFQISCDMRKNNLYQYRNDGLPKNPLVSPEVVSEQAKLISEIKNETAPAIIVKAELPKDEKKLTKLCERLLPGKKSTRENPNYHITRYFKNPKKPTETIIVFEKQM